MLRACRDFSRTVRGRLRRRLLAPCAPGARLFRWRRTFGARAARIGIVCSCCQPPCSLAGCRPPARNPSCPAGNHISITARIENLGSIDHRFAGRYSAGCLFWCNRDGWELHRTCGHGLDHMWGKPFVEPGPVRGEVLSCSDVIGDESIYNNITCSWFQRKTADHVNVGSHPCRRWTAGVH